MYSPPLLTCGKGEAFVSDPGWLCFPIFFNLTLMRDAATTSWQTFWHICITFVFFPGPGQRSTA